MKKIDKEECVDKEEYNGEDYGSDGLYHALDILERTLGKVTGYQSDDGIIDHKCAITAIRKLYKQKPAKWSKEDENRLEEAICMIESNGKWVRSNDAVKLVSDWLKSIKGRVQPQPKQEWSKEDKVKINRIVAFLENPNLKKLNIIDDNNIFKKDVGWLKSLRPQNTWKPSKEQIDALEHFVRSIGESGYASPYENNTKLLYSLLEQLKKLK